jgi:hypothetical protein
MISPLERHRLESAYPASVDAHVLLARCAAGLLVIVGIALIGATSYDDGQGANTSVSAPRAASGR